ncbi:MAG TPA: DUF72 domain-containing protein [Gemmatimonadales bacterium]|nr:DUF72 domain-containing protein [Gemmatimonadales bacterium]
MRVAVGTSGFAYKEWKGSFYPADLKDADMLRFYGERFKTVEINNTFYRMPTEKLLANWAMQVPADFTFVLKASQRITHLKRLKGAADDVAYFTRTAATLGQRLGPTLVQLPPNFKKDVARLEEFLAALPDGWRAAFEFRHASWYEDDVYAALRARNQALCAADTDEDEGRVVATADWGYLRLRREAYGKSDLAVWATRVLGQPWREAFVFFKHEDAGAGPALAQAFMSALTG